MPFVLIHNCVKHRLKESLDFFNDEWKLKCIIFYGFQKGSFLAYCMNESGNYESFYGYYKLKDDEISITLWPDNSSGNETAHEELVNSASYKKFFGWGDTGERTFKVEELTNKKMRLNYEGMKYVFRKY